MEIAVLSFSLQQQPMCGVRRRPKFHETFEKTCRLDINLFTHLSFRQEGDWNCCIVSCKNPLNKIKFINIPIPLLHRIRQIKLPSAYWLLSLLRHVSKYNTAPLRQKSSLPFQRWLEIYSPIADYKLSITGLINQLLAKDMNKMCTGGNMQLLLWSPNKCIYSIPPAINTVQFKVNVRNPYMAMVCVEYGLSRAQ
jgi:hypothetical protein